MFTFSTLPKTGRRYMCWNCHLVLLAESDCGCDNTHKFEMRCCGVSMVEVEKHEFQPVQIEVQDASTNPPDNSGSGPGDH